MLKLNEAWTYNDYISSTLHEHHKSEQNELFEKLQLSDEVQKELSKVDTLTNIFVFAEVACPDCRAVVPILEKMNRENDHINLYIFPRKGNERFLSLNTKASRIPSIMIDNMGYDDVIDEGLVLVFEEFPESLKSDLESLSADERGTALQSFRDGNLSNDIQNELIEKILKLIKKG